MVFHFFQICDVYLCVDIYVYIFLIQILKREEKIQDLELNSRADKIVKLIQVKFISRRTLFWRLLLFFRERQQWEIWRSKSILNKVFKRPFIYLCYCIKWQEYYVCESSESLCGRCCFILIWCPDSNSADDSQWNHFSKINAFKKCVS